MSACERADVDHLTGIFDGFRATMVINAAVELGLFDLLEKTGDKGVTARQLAEDQGWDDECTGRMLDACVSLKLLQKSSESVGQDNVYQNASPGRCLIKSADYSMSGIVRMMKRLYDPLSKLSEEVKTGCHKSSLIPHHVTVHKPGSHQHGCQGHHGGHHGQEPSEEALLSRYRSMDGVCRPYANLLVSAFDLGQYKTAVDLGAGSGVLSFELARTYPSMHVTLFEVPNVVELVKKYFVPKTEQLDVALVAGDFNEVDLPRADLFLLAKIVHDWNPPQITSLLSRVYASLSDGGAIMLLEKCLNDNKDGPAMAHLWDITVMSCCAGRLRSGAEFTSLLEGLGFRDVKIHKMNVECSVDVIIATK